MSETPSNNPDKFEAPTEAQLSAAGLTITQKIQEAVIHRKLYPPIFGADEPHWEYVIQGVGALEDKGGYVPISPLKIWSNEESSTATTRAFDITFFKTSEAESPDHRAEIYQAVFQKNTQILVDLRKATLSSDYLEDLQEEFHKEIEEVVEEERGISSSVFEALIKAEVKRTNRFSKDLNLHLQYGQCGRQEFIELVEILQRCRPQEDKLGGIGTLLGF